MMKFSTLRKHGSNVQEHLRDWKRLKNIGKFIRMLPLCCILMVERKK